MVDIQELLAEMPEAMRRRIEDGISRVAWPEDEDDRWTFEGADWDVIAAMTPEQRDYYGLTEFYEFVLALPEEYRPQ